MLYVLTFGNPYLKEDNLAIRVAELIIQDKISGIKIVKCVSPDEILNYMDKEFIIFDVVKGAKDIMIIDDIDRLKSGRIVSLHDFDLGFFLKLMKETGKIEKLKIIGIPQEGNVKIIKKKVKDKIISLLPIQNQESV